MRGALRIGSIAGIAIFVHWTFLLLVAWVAGVYWVQGHGPLAALNGILFLICLFAIVVLHELSHALTARRFGVKTRDIVLLPIGGVSRMERIPEVPSQELLVALAGPAVNVALAAILFGILGFMPHLQTLSRVAASFHAFVAQLFYINVILAVFNLLPAFPMDGGRALRALLAMRMDYAEATRVAALVGQGMAILFGFLGLFTNPWLLVIAFFVWIGAAGESGITQVRSGLAGIPVSRAMISDFHRLRPEDTLETAVQAAISGFQHEFPVVDGGRLVGLLTNKDLLTGLSEHGASSAVELSMHRDVDVVDASTALDDAFQKLAESEVGTLPVTRGGEVVGLLTGGNLAEILSLQKARRAARQPPLTLGG